MKLQMHSKISFAIVLIAVFGQSAVHAQWNFTQLLNGTFANSTNTTSSGTGNSPNATSNSNMYINGMPVVQSVTNQTQSIPALETESETVENVVDSNGLITSQQQVINKSLPSNYKSLMQLSNKAAPSNSNSNKCPPPVTQLEFCDFDDLYKDVLLLVNVVRKKLALKRAQQTMPSMASLLPQMQNSSSPLLNGQQLAALGDSTSSMLPNLKNASGSLTAQQKAKLLSSQQWPMSAAANLPGKVCMNGKLMMAAKLQSDFQALAKMPTHAGPRQSQLGSLEERLVWARFNSLDTPQSRAASSSSETDLGIDFNALFNGAVSTSATPTSIPTAIASGAKGNGSLIKSTAEELIYYWPKVGGEDPITTPLDRKVFRARIIEAIKAWATDLPSIAVLTNPDYRFFGAGITRTKSGSMYLTVVLADSPIESCNICPFDVPTKNLIQSPSYSSMADADDSLLSI